MSSLHYRAARKGLRWPDLLGLGARSRRRHRPEFWSLAVVALFVLAALVPQLFHTMNPDVSDLGQRLLPPGTQGHWLGTDALGRDVLARIVYGARYSFIVALAAVLISGVVGVGAGIASAFAPRIVSVAVMRLADAALGIPLFLVALTLAVVMGPGIFNVIVVVAGLLWAQYARVIAAEASKVRQLAYIDAARILGIRSITVVVRHVLPNIMPTVLTLLAGQVGAVILLEASLSFLGAGVPPPAPAWGTLVADGRDYIASAWWISVFPGAAILLVVVAINAQADWLRGQLDPRQSQRRIAHQVRVAARQAPHSISTSLPHQASAGAPLLQVSELHVEVPSNDPVPLVDGVSFEVNSGERVGLIGESGSGKSLTASSVVRLLPDGVVARAGQVGFAGSDLTVLSDQRMREVRGGRIGFVFQDHTASLDPTATVGLHIVEVLRAHLGMGRREARARAIALLDQVGIPDPRSRLNAYPHQFSGGMGQRVAIAAAIAGEPDLLIADEPTTALDATMQVRIVELLQRLCQDKAMALLLITHDLGLASRACSRIMVMYAGRILESGPTNAVVSNPGSPYTRALLAAIPDPNLPRDQPLGAIAGVPEAPGKIRVGCRFANRCPLVQRICREQEPELTLRESGSKARCFATEPGGWSAP